MPKSHTRDEVVQPIDKPYRLIPLTQHQVAIVDAEDFEMLSRWNWCAAWNKRQNAFYAQRSKYAARSKKGVRSKTVQMHFEVMGCMCDHKNHNTLDNRKDNLRPCTTAQNNLNRPGNKGSKSGYKGVTLNNGKGGHNIWRVRIQIDGKSTFLGRFHTPEEAAHAYDEAAKIYHGEFAHLNFPALADYSSSSTDSSSPPSPINCA